MVNLDGNNGFVINGAAGDDEIGHTIYQAGDVNCDGYADVLLAGKAGGGAAADVFVVYGGEDLPATLNLTDIDGSNGFAVVRSGDGGSNAVQAMTAGDINGDNCSDILVSYSGDSIGVKDAARVLAYVIYGAKSDPPSSRRTVLNVSSLNATDGTVIIGSSLQLSSNSTRYLVRGGGDINGDTVPDILILATSTRQHNNSGALFDSTIYGVLGSHNMPEVVHINETEIVSNAALFAIHASQHDSAGYASLEILYDVNGDKIDDFVYTDDQSLSYVIYGARSYQHNMSLLSDGFNATYGVIVSGDKKEPGFQVAAAGDVNGDGFHDFMFGLLSEQFGIMIYLVLGSDTLPSNITISISETPSYAGVIVMRATYQDFDPALFSLSMGTALDLNDDGHSDLLVGVHSEDPNPSTFFGEVFIVYGGLDLMSYSVDGDRPQGLSLNTLDGIIGARINGPNGINDKIGVSVAGVGDINADGLNDFAIGAPWADTSHGNDTGRVFVYFSRKSTTSSSITSSSTTTTSSSSSSSTRTSTTTTTATTTPTTSATTSVSTTHTSTATTTVTSTATTTLTSTVTTTQTTSVTTTETSTVTTTPTTTWTTKTAEYDCEGCASGSGGCRIVSTNYCFAKTDGKCPASNGVTEIQDCYEDTISMLPFCVGVPEGAGATTGQLFAPGSSCSRAPYRYSPAQSPAVSVFKGYHRIHRQRELWCIGVKLDDRNGHKSFMEKANCLGPDCEDAQCDNAGPGDAVYDIEPMYLPRELDEDLAKLGWMSVCIYSSGASYVMGECGGPPDESMSSWEKEEAVIKDFRCGEGFYKASTGFCVDIDECDVSEEESLCLQYQDCTNTRGSFECQCTTGFTTIEDGSCEDIDECGTLAEDACPMHATCSNNVGDYECLCDTGFRAEDEAITNSSVVCSNVDECDVFEFPTSPCGMNTVCNDTIGSFNCECAGAGYVPDLFSETQCNNVNECDDVNICPTNSTCADNEGSFTCDCILGYEKAGSDTENCVDIDECLRLDACSANATCINSIGSFDCSCDTGFISNVDDPLVCDNINECESETTCGLHAVCDDMIGSFECNCKSDGFMKSYPEDIYCQDLNECDADPCGLNQTCHNSVGSFSCTCDDGFDLSLSGSPLECDDIDECQPGGTALCNSEATCLNTQGSYTCFCNEGYSGNGVSCVNVNECASSEFNTCSTGTSCTDMDGSFRCDCLPGWIADAEDDTTCDDVDECVNSDDNSCHEKALCSNTMGSFECTCIDGYSGDGSQVCRSINECLTEQHDCDSKAECFDMEGSFRCECKTGWDGNGTVCKDKDECLVNATDSAAPCDESAACVNNAGSFECACNSGYEGTGQVGMCDDINECILNTHDCRGDNLVGCRNVPGGFVCECDLTLMWDGTSCVDADECELGTDACDENATCINTLGSYTCECDIGFQGNGTLCSDIDECDEDESNGNNRCNEQGCINTIGSFVCDPDECVDGTDDCHDNAQCTNTIGGFECYCNDGFIGDGKLHCNATTTTTTIVDAMVSTTAISNESTSFGEGDGSSGDSEDGMDRETLLIVIIVVVSQLMMAVLCIVACRSCRTTEVASQTRVVTLTTENPEYIHQIGETSI